MIDWNDNAEAAVREFADWFLTGYSYLAEVDKFLGEKRSPTQKTVADAVEAFDGEWPKRSQDCEYMSWTGFNFAVTRVRTVNHVCTRAEFEAYVKEQEGEKWTHTWNGRKCRVLFTEDYTSWIKCEGLKNAFAKTDDLKPIKPTISKSEAWDKLMQNKMNSSEVNTIKQKYDII